jgi:hypothetical protein
MPAKYAEDAKFWTPAGVYPVERRDRSDIDFIVIPA